MNIGLLLPNWIGDVVMATPTIRALRENYGSGATFVGVMRPYVSKVLEGTDWIDEHVFFDRRSKNADHRLWSVARRLRKMELDSFFYFPNSLSSAWLGYLSGAKNRIGYRDALRSLLLTHKVEYIRQGGKKVPTSAITHYLRMAETIGAEASDDRMELATTSSDRSGAERVWQQLKLHETKEVVLFHGANGSGNSRLWPRKSFLQLAQRVVNERDASAVFLCGPGETEEAASLANAASHPRISSMADQDLSLGVSKACIERAQLLVSTDSGPRHIGAALGTPVIGLCGPIDTRLTYSEHQQAITVKASDVPCAPCNKLTCRFGTNECMERLGVEQVFKAVEEQLDAHADRNAA